MLPIYVNVSFSCFCLKKCFKLSSFSLLSLFRPSSTVNLSENNFLFSPKFYSSSQFSSFSLKYVTKMTNDVEDDDIHQHYFKQSECFKICDMKLYFNAGIVFGWWKFMLRVLKIFLEMQTKCSTIGRSSVRTLSSVKKWCQSQPLMVLPKHLNWLQIQSCVG